MRKTRYKVKTRKEVKKIRGEVLKRRIKRLQTMLEDANERESYWCVRVNCTPLTNHNWRRYYDRQLKARMEVNELKQELREAKNFLEKESK